MLGTIVTWFILSLFVGLIGSSRKIGFWSAFFLSLFLSPLLGLIFTIVSKSQSQEAFEQRTLDLHHKQLQTMQQGSFVRPSVSDELRKLKQLADEGLLSSAEYEAQRSKILGN
ncbi:SHOCT domain-containing protein [Fibrella sp. HMF5335]|uniref:SHOCT domain-containing protein n=1 Tax=Fibrella rubiginis TaxID=2817060 RepID=A0A939GLM5_9BACT|nr:SHOCT domain-containing protein [Fibrella rubiginis]MBO0938687.1 SHOCT domain-containing protein [Fibrella rubiginis]